MIEDGFQGVHRMERAKEANLLFRNGRVIDPAGGIDEVSDVLILDGVLAEMRPQMNVTADLLSRVKEMDSTGKWIVPGLLDMHVHLREPGEEYKETIESGTRAAAAGGYAGVACMPNTNPVNDCAAVTRFIIECARTSGACRVFPVGAISMGSKGENLTEFGDLKDSGAVAVSDDGRPVMNALLMRRALEYARAFDLPVISHAEDSDLSRGGLMNEGPLAARLGLRGIPAAAEEVMIARDLILAEFTGGRLHIAHVSSNGSVRLIREAKRRGVPVTCETAPHYFTLTDTAVESFDAVYKMNPPLRRAEDVRGVKEGLADGTIDAIATDHAPHSVLEKDTEFELASNGVVGLESAVPLILNLVREKVLSPIEAVAKVSCNPASILGVPFGRLRTGTSADLTVIDPDERYVLDCERFESKGRNCPFHGMEMQGRPLLTIVNGKTVFSGFKP